MENNKHLTNWVRGRRRGEDNNKSRQQEGGEGESQHTTTFKSAFLYHFEIIHEVEVEVRRGRKLEPFVHETS